MAKNNSLDGVPVLTAIVKILVPLDVKTRTWVLNSVAAFFEHEAGTPTSAPSQNSSLAGPNTIARPLFSEDKAPSPKEFLFHKQPKTDVERIACLAFYLTHFRDMPHFKTLDLAKLNTEAAQIKFSNATYAADNAAKAGYLAVASKGTKQITAWGEQFVTALPDREAALKVIAQARQRRNARRKRR
jgi:hypothetical protein